MGFVCCFVLFVFDVCGYSLFISVVFGDFVYFAGVWMLSSLGVFCLFDVVGLFC